MAGSVALFILGLLLTLAGIIFVFRGRFDPPDEQEDLTIADVLERLNHVVEKVEKRYRWGIVMIALGLALIGAGAWLAALSAYSAASMPPPPPPPA